MIPPCDNSGCASVLLAGVDERGGQREEDPVPRPVQAGEGPSPPNQGNNNIFCRCVLKLVDMSNPSSLPLYKKDFIEVSTFTSFTLFYLQTYLYFILNKSTIVQQKSLF